MEDPEVKDAAKVEVSVESRRLKRATLRLKACKNQVESAGKLCAGWISDGDEMSAGALAPLGTCVETGPGMPLIARCEQTCT